MGRLADAFSAGWSTLVQRDGASEIVSRGTDRRTGGRNVTGDAALRHSGVWACIRLRADLVSTMPVDVYRRVAGVQVEVVKPRWLEQPFPGTDITEWLWATQADLDRYGNAFGFITARDAAGRMAECELVDAGSVSVVTQGRRVTKYRIAGEEYDPALIWHEKQYAPAGSPIGMSPVAYAALSIGGYLSAQDFAQNWYDAGASPAGVLRNVERKLVRDVADDAKASFKESVRGRDLFVTGKDWEWTPAAGGANDAAFLDEMRYGITDVARFFGVPGDMIDAEGSGSSITYANVTQRNLQLLIVNLNPAIIRRERAFSNALAQPRFVKLNSDALLRMDPQTRSQVLTDQVNSRRLSPSEARALDNRPPFTEDELSEFDRLFGAKNPAPAPASTERWAQPYVITQVSDLPRAQIESGWVPPGDVTVEGQPR